MFYASFYLFPFHFKMALNMNHLLSHLIEYDSWFMIHLWFVHGVYLKFHIEFKKLDRYFTRFLKKKINYSFQCDSFYTIHLSPEIFTAMVFFSPMFLSSFFGQMINLFLFDLRFIHYARFSARKLFFTWDFFFPRDSLMRATQIPYGTLHAILS